MANMAEPKPLPDRFALSNLENKFVRNGFELERIKLFQHQGPVENTLRTIDESGLLSTLVNVQKTEPGAITEIAITPILPMTGRWEVTRDPYDRLFVVIQPKKYNEVVASLKQQGFAVDEEHPSSGFEPYFFDENGNKFTRGVHNPDAFIIQTDFPRSEKVSD